VQVLSFLVFGRVGSLCDQRNLAYEIETGELWRRGRHRCTHLFVGRVDRAGRSQPVRGRRRQFARFRAVSIGWRGEIRGGWRASRWRRCHFAAWCRDRRRLFHRCREAEQLLDADWLAGRLLIGRRHRRVLSLSLALLRGLAARRALRSLSLLLAGRLLGGGGGCHFRLGCRCRVAGREKVGYVQIVNKTSSSSLSVGYR